MSQIIATLLDDTMGDFETLGGSRLTRLIAIVYVVLSMRTFPRTMDFTW